MRAISIVVTLVLAAAAVLIAWIMEYLIWYEACDQHGGVARDSPAGRFCEGPLGGGWLLVGIVGPPLAAVLLVVAVARRRSVVPALWVAAGTALVVAVLAAFAMPLSSDCSPADYRAWERWDREGSRDEPPADCYSY